MKRLIIDGASVAWQGLFAGTDEEFGKKVDFNGRSVQINSAHHGRENALNMIHAAWERFGITPINTILVKEGEHSKSLRQNVYPAYKAGSSERPPEQYQEFNRLVADLQDDLLSVGGCSVTQNGVEGDDVIAYLCRHLEGEKFILTGDGDMTALVNETTHVWRQGALDVNPYGEFPFHYITLYKALVGDTSDNIKGAPGFGQKSFLDLLCAFGDDGLELMEDLIINKKLDKLSEDVPQLKSLQKIIDGASSVYQSYQVAKLWPNSVDLVDNPLQWAAGYVRPKKQVRNDARLAPWGGQHRLIHDNNFGPALTFFKEKMAESPTVTLDLETSVGEESHDWLEQRSKTGGGVDVIGSKITGCGLTFGSNNQYSYYIAVDHATDFAVPNVSLDKLGEMLQAIPKTTMTLAHNAAGFELPVLANAFREKWAKNGWRGFFPNMIDTRIAASYWDENAPSHGLKQLSNQFFGYEQISYDTVTQGKTMRQLTAEHVFAYGIDDVVMTSALWNAFRMKMEIEKTLTPFFQLEQKPMYLSALGYVEGIKIDLERLFKLKSADEKAASDAHMVVDGFLLDHGWEGTVCPVITELDAKSIKTVFEILTGTPLETAVRTPAKLIALIRASTADDAELIAALMEDNNLASINMLVSRKFDNTPEFEESSPKQVKKLLYEVMGMPVRLRNKATDTMRSKGITQGTERTDEDAMQMALKMGDAGEHAEVLKSLIALRSINTRRGLYWEPYPKAIHWKTGKIHPEMRQSGTNTRRWSSSNPNIQQLDSKKGGVRTVILPHHADAVVVSLDESGQEVRLAAAYSKDANLLSCFMGSADQLRDVHSIVACRIAGVSYDEFRARLKGVDVAEAEAAGKIRSIAKTVLFASFYGAAAPKIAETLGITEGEAQMYIDTIYTQFKDLANWKKRVEVEAKSKGYAEIWGGTRRHLASLMNSADSYTASKALRQASNAAIQSAGANQLKTIMTRVWDSDVMDKYDIRWTAVVHDEIVFSVGKKDAVNAIRVMHSFMVAPFLDGGVPSASSIGIGANFGDLIELGEVFNPEQIESTLTHLFLETQSEAG